MAAVSAETISVGTTATLIAHTTGTGGQVTFTVPASPPVQAGGSDLAWDTNSKLLPASSEITYNLRDGGLYLIVQSTPTDVDFLFTGME